jgi:hypothetical protein
MAASAALTSSTPTVGADLVKAAETAIAARKK